MQSQQFKNVVYRSKTVKICCLGFIQFQFLEKQSPVVHFVFFLKSTVLWYSLLKFSKKIHLKLKKLAYSNRNIDDPLKNGWYVKMVLFYLLQENSILQLHIV